VGAGWMDFNVCCVSRGSVRSQMRCDGDEGVFLRDGCECHPFPAGGTQIPAARAAQGSKEETPCAALGCTSKCHSKLHALLCPDCILILSHQCGLQGSRPERANRPLQTLRPKLILTLCFLQLFTVYSTRE
jgi:hypothetical protein